MCCVQFRTCWKGLIRAFNWGHATASRWIWARNLSSMQNLNLKDSGVIVMVSSLWSAWLLTNQNSALRYGEVVSGKPDVADDTLNDISLNNAIYVNSWVWKPWLMNETKVLDATMLKWGTCVICFINLFSSELSMKVAILLKNVFNTSKLSIATPFSQWLQLSGQWEHWKLNLVKLIEQ